MSKMLQGMRIATIDLAMHDETMITDFFVQFDIRHLDMMLNLCETAWDTGDVGRSVLDEDASDWGIDFDFPTGW